MKGDLTFIVKNTFDCNLQCEYCYEGARPKSQVLSTRTVDKLIEKSAQHVLKNQGLVTFIWHGGEPLLNGIDFFEHIVVKQKSMGSDFKFTNSVQTNGVLLDDRFADFFKKHNFLVGVSLDGPPDIHDAQRIVSPNRGSFHDAYEALVRLDDRDIRTGTIAIFTRHTYQNLERFYNFFSERSLNVSINPLLVKGSARSIKAASLRVSPEEWGKGMIYLFDRWADDPNTEFRVTPFNTIVRALTSGKVHRCNGAGECYNYFKVFPNGNLHLCGFQDEDLHVVGNIINDQMEDIIASPEIEKYKSIKAAVSEMCKPCRHHGICRGGCTHSAFTRNGKFVDVDYYCEGYLALYDHIKQKLPQLLSPKHRQLLQPMCARH